MTIRFFSYRSRYVQQKNINFPAFVEQMSKIEVLFERIMMRLLQYVCEKNHSTGTPELHVIQVHLQDIDDVTSFTFYNKHC